MCVDNRVGHRPPGTITKTVLLPLSLPSRFLSFSQADSGPRGVSRERLGAEAPHQQEKGGPSVPAHLIGNPYAFGLSPGAVMQDARFQPLKSVTLPVQYSPDSTLCPTLSFIRCIYNDQIQLTK